MKQMIIFFVVGLIGLFAVFYGLVASADHPEMIEVTVQSGDTLWNIAHTYYEDGRDIRSIVAEIQTYNELDGAIIHPGQILQVPKN